MNPVWDVLGTLLASAVIAEGYLAVRDDLTSTEVNDNSQDEMASPTDPESSKPPAEVPHSVGVTNPEPQPQARVLDHRER
ncbi:hypothetical protein [Halogranum amylolyticum]|nr:hypothetical protein [Halogranum amylolyticum]